MARITFNINDDLDKRIREYIDKYTMTYTAFLSLASEKYLASELMGQEINDIFKEIFLKEVAKLGKDFKG